MLVFEAKTFLKLYSSTNFEMNNVTLFIIIMIMVLTLDCFSREGIQLPENQISNGSNSHNTKVMIKQTPVFSSFLNKIAESYVYAS